MTPEFLVVGHITRDLVGDEVRSGGTASFAAVVAARLGLRTAILTSAADDLQLPPELAGVQIERLPAGATTVFAHRWHGRVREQYLLSHAETIHAAAVPAEFRRTPVVLFGPIAGEVEAALCEAFPAALRGATVQGWLRRFAADGHLEPRDAPPELASVVAALQVLILSEEDLPAGQREHLLASWQQQVPLIAVTLGERGARICDHGRWGRIAAFPAREVDATGAGDAFAAAFLIRYHETANVAAAARFAAATASFVVGAKGIAGAPTRGQVEARLDAEPALRLQAE